MSLSNDQTHFTFEMECLDTDLFRVKIDTKTFLVRLIPSLLLGQGNVANVYHATMDNERIACKCIKKHIGWDEGLTDWKAETRAIDAIKEHPDSKGCPYLPMYFGSARGMYDDLRVMGLIFMELLPCGTIADLIDEVKKGRKPAFADEFIFRTLYQMATALSICHKAGVAHMDFKATNVIYDEERSRAILIDFNLSQYRTPFISWEHASGSPMYAAPEIILCKEGINPYLADVWCFGQFCFELLTLDSQFTQATNMTQLADLVQSAPRASDDPLVAARDPMYTKLLDATLVYDFPKDRWTFDDIVLFLFDKK